VRVVGAQLVVGELGPPDSEAQLVEREVFADPDRERQRHDLEPQAAVVAVGDLVEAGGVVGDDPG
jgi:hypothetical protein